MKRMLPLLLFLLLPNDSKADVPSPLAERCVQHYAAHYRVPPELIAALIDVESRWDATPGIGTSSFFLERVLRSQCCSYLYGDRGKAS
jgi:hypothetical protein